MSDPLLDKLDVIITTFKRQAAEPRSIFDHAAMWAALRHELRALLAEVAIEATEAQWLTRSPREQWDPWIAADMRRHCRARFGVAPEQEEGR